MQQFSGLEYTKIAVANAFGLDKENWDVRLNWFNDNVGNFKQLITQAKEPIKFRKACTAYHDAMNFNPTGYLMDLDGTASGLQVFAALTGCRDTARNVNLLPDYDRMCPYGNLAKTMSAISSNEFKRDDVKQPLMTVFYGSKAQPEAVFGEGTPELEAFYKSLSKEFPGAIEALGDIQSCWQSDAIAHQWVMPDGHHVYVPVRAEKRSIIEVDNLDGLKFTQAYEVIEAQEDGISLAANVIHSIDAYVCRQMIRKAYDKGFRILTVHDAFFASPNRMNFVRQFYRQILADIADSNLLSDILSQIVGYKVEFQKFSLGLGNDIRKANYHLS